MKWIFEPKGKSSYWKTEAAIFYGYVGSQEQCNDEGEEFFTWWIISNFNDNKSLIVEEKDCLFQEAKDKVENRIQKEIQKLFAKLKAAEEELNSDFKMDVNITFEGNKYVQTFTDEAWMPTLMGVARDGKDVCNALELLIDMGNKLRLTDCAKPFTKSIKNRLGVQYLSCLGILEGWE